ncbi:hypothetical protein GCM10029963_65160 [Micromonospora andamanensis]
MCDLLVIGGLGVDVRVRVPRLPLPVVDSVTVDPIELRVGNTGAGVALAAHALGLRVTVVDTVGVDPAGAVVRAALARTGVRTVLADDPAGTRRSVNLVDPDGRRMSLYDPRGSDGPPPFAAAQVAELAGDATHVHLSIMGWVRDLLPDLNEVLGEGWAPRPTCTTGTAATRTTAPSPRSPSWCWSAARRSTAGRRRWPARWHRARCW